MYQLVAALRCRSRRLQRPKHRDTQGERNNHGERYVEVLAHANRLTALGAEHKWKLSLGGFAVKAKEAPNHGVGDSDKHICGVEHTILALIKHMDLHIHIHTAHLIK